MSKAVLVIDMPEACEYCKFHYTTYDEDDDYVDKCEVLNDKTIDGYARKYHLCPLKSLPEYDSPSINPTTENVYYAQGWNDCIDEILKGGTEE